MFVFSSTLVPSTKTQEDFSIGLRSKMNKDIKSYFLIKLSKLREFMLKTIKKNLPLGSEK